MSTVDMSAEWGELQALKNKGDSRTTTGALSWTSSSSGYFYSSVHGELGLYAAILQKVSSTITKDTDFKSNFNDLTQLMSIGDYANGEGMYNKRKVDHAIAADMLDPGPYCRLFRSGDFGISTNTVAIPFDTMQNDNDNMFNPSSPTRITINKAGVYLIIGNASFRLPNVTAATSLQICKNGTDVLALNTVPNVANGCTENILTISTLFDFYPNDYLELKVWQNSGSSATITSGNGQPNFMAMKLGE